MSLRACKKLLRASSTLSAEALEIVEDAFKSVDDAREMLEMDSVCSKRRPASVSRDRNSTLSKARVKRMWMVSHRSYHQALGESYPEAPKYCPKGTSEAKMRIPRRNHSPPSVPHQSPISPPSVPHLSPPLVFARKIEN